MEIDAAVERFAPVLAFDKDFRGLPMDAQDYFEAVLGPVVAADGSSMTFTRKIGNTLGTVGNNPADKSKALAALDGVPTYYMVGVDPATVALRIQYGGSTATSTPARLAKGPMMRTGSTSWSRRAPTGAGSTA